jgi:hypothetical protein
MTQSTRILLTGAALLLAACEHGNQAPGALPQVGSYTSNVPGSAPTPCASGAINCATVPDPYGVIAKKDTPPKIVFPDYPSESPNIQAPIGNSYSVLVSTTNVSGIELTCSPTAVVSLSPNTTAGDYLLYLGSMPDKDVECVLTGQGTKEKVSAKLIFHPAAVGYVEMLEVRNLLTSIPLKISESFTLKNFFIKGYDKTTTVKVTCTSGQAPQLEPVKDKIGWYNMTVSGPKTPETTETCTVSALRASDGQKAAANVELITPPKSKAAVIAASNFMATAQLYAQQTTDKFGDKNSPDIKNAVVRIGSATNSTFPQVWVHSTEEDFPTVSLSCTGKNSASFIAPCEPIVKQTCESDPDYVACLTQCGGPGDELYLKCTNKCYFDKYTPCANKACSQTPSPSNVIPMAISGIPSKTKAYDLYIHYLGWGTPGTTDTCTVTATNEDLVASTLTFTIRHDAKPFAQSATSLNSKLATINEKVTSDPFAITPYDSTKDKVSIFCSADTSATVTSTNNVQVPGEFVINTVAPSAVGGVNGCNVMVVHEGAQTAYTSFAVTAKQP